MVIFEDGEREGQLSGGCLERDIVEQSIRLLQSNEPLRLLTYVGDDDPVFGFNKGCQGTVHLLLEKTEWLYQHRSRLLKALALDYPIRYGIWLKDGNAGRQLGSRILQIGETIIADPGMEGIEFMSSDGLHVQQIEREQRLLLIGAGYDAIPVMDLASKLSYEVHAADYREAHFERASQQAPGVKLSRVGRDKEALAEFLLRFSTNTAVVIMSHDFDYDRLALESALKRSFLYIGVLGPRHRLNRLYGSESPPGCIYSPIGLEIGAQTPEEIAVSILGQIIQTFRSRMANVSGDVAVSKKNGELVWR